MRLLLGWAINAAALFLLPYLVPAVQIKKYTNGEDADSAMKCGI